MSASNRTTGLADVTALAATVDLAELKTSLNLLWDSSQLTRDVINTVTLGAATTVNFSGYDTIIGNTTVSSAITLSNIVDGEVKYLIVNKSTGNQITFANAIAMDFNPTYTHTLTLVVYKLISKGSAGILAIPQHKSFDYSAIPTLPTPTVWTEATLTAAWIGDISYTRNGVWYREYDGYLDLSVAIYRPGTLNVLMTTLPNGYRPAYDMPLSFNISPAGVSDSFSGLLRTNGELRIIGTWSSDPRYVSGLNRIPLT